MILRAITITHWRCFLEDVALGPFDERLTIVHGPNGAGKSTVFQALCRGLLDGHRVSGKDIETMRPWGRALAPRVVVEFSHNGQTYRIAKQYLDSQFARLEREEAGRFTPLAEGAAADEQTRNMLTRNAPGKGLSKAEHWGVAQVLWAPQGELAFSSLSEDLRADIHALLGSQLSGAGAGPVEERIRARYLDVFTPKGKLRSGQDAPRIEQVRKEIEEARDAQRQALEAYLAYEDAARRVEECRSRRAYSRNSLEEIAKRRDVSRAAVENWRVLQAERSRRQDNAKAMEAQFNELQRHIKAVQSTETELSQAIAERDALDAETAPRAQELKDREQEVARQKAALENARKGREKVDAARNLAEAARRFLECGRALDALDAHIARIAQAETALNERKQQRNALRAPDAKTIRAARAALKERDNAQLRIEASLITLEIVPAKSGDAEVLSGELPGAVTLQADTPLQVKGSPEVVVDLPQVARLRAWGPTGAVEEHRTVRAEADKRLGDALAAYGVRDIEALETLAEKARTLDAATMEAQTILHTLLAGRSKESMEQERGAAEAQRRHFLEDHPEWASTRPDAQALESEAAAMERAFIETVETTEIAWQKAHGAFTAAAEKQETHLRRIEEARRRAQTLTEKRAELTQDGRTREEREQALRQMAMGWEASRARLHEIEAQCADCEEDPEGIARQLDAQYEAAVHEAAQARETEVREETRLEQLSARGTYTALALAEERLARFEEEHSRETLRVEAIRLLHDTVAACRDEALAAVAGPVEEAATRTFQRIAGRRLGRIQVGPSFAPMAVAPETAEASVNLDNLSGGEQEQLYLATRLALADALAKHERQMVVLDDVLTATDAGRFARVMTVLEEAAQRLQVIILTCHPERYRGMGNAHFINIEANRA